jgi:hypothetical protein
MKPTAYTLAILKRLSMASGRSQTAIVDRLVREEFARECELLSLDPEAVSAGWRSPLPDAIAEVVELAVDGVATHAEVRLACGLPAREVASAIRAAGAVDINVRRYGKTLRAWRGIRLR